MQNNKNELTIQAVHKKEPNYLLIQVITTIAFIAVLLMSSDVIKYKGLQANGIKIAQNIFAGIFTPDLELLFNFTKNGVPYILLETLAIAFLGTMIGAILALPIAFISASNMVPKAISTFGVLFIAAVRTMPAFVYGIMFIRVTGPGPFAGVLTLAVTSIGMIAKLYIEAIEDIDRGIIESLDASGCNAWQKIRYGVIPQLMSNFLSTVIYRYEINIKNAAILGLVGAGGIGAPLIFAMSAYRWREVGAILVGLIVVVLIVEMISTYLRKKLAHG